MKAIFEFGLLPSEKFEKILEVMKLDVQLILKNVKAILIFFRSTNYCLFF